jgi:hypothetical protein
MGAVCTMLGTTLMVWIKAEACAPVAANCLFRYHQIAAASATLVPFSLGVLPLRAAAREKSRQITHQAPISIGHFAMISWEFSRMWRVDNVAFTTFEFTSRLKTSGACQAVSG